MKKECFVQALREIEYGEIDAQMSIDDEQPFCLDRFWFHKVLGRKYKSVWLTPDKVFEVISKKDTRKFYEEKRAKKRPTHLARAHKKVKEARETRQALSSTEQQLELRKEKIEAQLGWFRNHINALRELGFKLTDAEVDDQDRLENERLSLESKVQRIQDEMLFCDYREMAGERSLLFLMKRQK